MKGKKTGGRTRGTPNRATVEVRLAAAELVDDPAYRAKLLRDFRARKIAPAIEVLFWHFAKGKPVDRAEVGQPGEFDVSKLSNAELKAELQKWA